jgi:hypothetical protein
MRSVVRKNPMIWHKKDHFKADFRLRNRDNVERVAISLWRFSENFFARTRSLFNSPGLGSDFFDFVGLFGMGTE